MTEPHYPPGWDQERVRKVLEYYENQSDDEAVAEDEAAYETTTHTTMEVPVTSFQRSVNSSRGDAQHNKPLERLGSAARPRPLNGSVIHTPDPFRSGSSVERIAAGEEDNMMLSQFAVGRFDRSSLWRAGWCGVLATVMAAVMLGAAAMSQWVKNPANGISTGSPRDATGASQTSTPTRTSPTGFTPRQRLSHMG